MLSDSHARIVRDLSVIEGLVHHAAHGSAPYDALCDEARVLRLQLAMTTEHARAVRAWRQIGERRAAAMPRSAGTVRVDGPLTA